MNNENEMQTGMEQSQETALEQQNPFLEVGTETQETDVGQQQQQTPSQPSLTQEQWTKLMQTTAETLKPLVQPQQQQQWTQEDFDRTFNVVRVTPELAAALGLAETSVPKLQEFAHAIARQATTMAEWRIGEVTRQMQQQFNQQLTPLQQYYKQQQDVEYERQFMTKHPEFKGMEPVLRNIYAKLQAEGRTFKTVEEAFNEVAGQAKTILDALKKAGAAPQQQNTTTSTGVPAQQGRKMSTLTGGGQGASGKSGTQQTTARAIFG